METLYLKRVVVKRDIEQVYVGLFMDTLTSFEQLIEELFVGLLSRRFVVQQAIIVPLMTFKNKKAIRPAVFGAGTTLIGYHTIEPRHSPGFTLKEEGHSLTSTKTTKNPSSSV